MWQENGFVEYVIGEAELIWIVCKSISGHTIEFHGLTGIVFSNTDQLNNQIE